MSGLEHISKAFSGAHENGRAALMPYFTLGYPTIDETAEIVCGLGEAGADLVELGVPFSDPLADGPTIQHSTHIALQNGMTVARCLEIVRKIRGMGMEKPILLMGYINPILSYGKERYVHEAFEAGVDGFIIPDLPLEEAGEMETLCHAHGLAFVFLATPGSNQERLQELAEHTTGFLYLVSINGVTGARADLPEGLKDFILRARSFAKTPVAVGFGIATHEQAVQVGKTADGVIIGSALIDAVGKSDAPVTAAKDFIKKIQGV